MSDIQSYGLKDIKEKSMFFDIDNYFQMMEDKRIDFKSFGFKNLGVAFMTSTNEDEKIFYDVTLDDLLELDSNYHYRAVIQTEKEKLPLFLDIAPAKNKDFRGELAFFPPKTIKFTQSNFFKGRKIKAEIVPIVMKDNKLYTPLEKIYKYNPAFDTLYNNAQIAICAAWEDFFQWRVRVKMPEWDKSIDFYINPANVKQVFKMREIEDGAQRRKALKHIVSAHTRTLSTGEKIEIMRYLRGKDKFSQNGYELTIIPSKDDVKSLQKKL